MATVLLLASVLAAASSSGAEPWDLWEGAWECAGVDDSAEATEEWPSRLEGLWLSQGCEPPLEWGGPWLLRSLLLERQPGAGASLRATLVTHVYADDWCARPLYSVAVAATLLQERRHGDEEEDGWSVRLEGATGCGHSWEGVRRVLALCCACAPGRHAKPHRVLNLYSRGRQQYAHGGGERDNVASRRHAEPAPAPPQPAAAECVSRLWPALPLLQLPRARVQKTAHRLGPRRELLLADAGGGGGRAQPPLLHAAQRRGCAACSAVSRGSLVSPPQLSARPRLPASAAAAPAAAWAASGSCRPPSPAVSLRLDATAAAWQLELEVRCAAPGPSWRAVASGRYVAEGAALRLRRARLTLEGAAVAAAGCPPDPRLALLDVDAEGDPALLVWAAGCGPVPAVPALELLPPLRLRRCRPRVAAAAAAAHVAASAPACAVAASLLPLGLSALRLAGRPWR